LEQRWSTALQMILAEKLGRAHAAKRIAEWIAGERQYRWVGIYEVTLTDIGMISCTGSAPSAFPRFPISLGSAGQRSRINASSTSAMFGRTRAG